MSAPDAPPDADARFPREVLEQLELPAALAWIAESAHTAAGRRRLRALDPAAGEAEAAARHRRGTECATLSAGAEEPPALEGCGDLDALLERSAARGLEGAELVAIAETVERLGRLRAWTAARAQALPALHAWLDEAPRLAPLAEELRRIVDGEGRVRDEADPRLAQVRADQARVETRRARVLAEIAETLHRQGALRQPQPVRRGARLVLAVRAGRGRGVRGAVHDRSQSGDTLFVEPAAALELSNRLAEHAAEERRLVTEVLREATRAVRRRRAELARLDEVVAETDAAFAAARWAEEAGAAFPARAGAGEALELRAARHPLLVRQMGRGAVVPLDLELGGAHDLLVVTGPNTGGKTVVLKTVGVLAALAACGMPVTADAATRFPELPALLADIGDAQSLASSLSTFSGHLRRICAVLEQAGPGALVLLDELGTGTDPEEGAAIGQAVLETLLAAGARTVANTHLGALKLFSLDVERAENASMEFDPESLAPRYRLLVGVPGASHAVEVAERLGLPEAVLERARRLAARDDAAERVLADVGRVRREAEHLKEQASEQTRAAAERAREVEAREQRSRLRQELREREAEEAFLGQRRALRALVDEEGRALARAQGGEGGRRLSEFLDRLGAALDGDPLAGRWQEFVRRLRKGDEVWVPRLQERLPVLKVDRRREKVRLRHGALEMDVPFREITWVEPPRGDES